MNPQNYIIELQNSDNPDFHVCNTQFLSNTKQMLHDVSKTALRFDVQCFNL